MHVPISPFYFSCQLVFDAYQESLCVISGRNFLQFLRSNSELDYSFRYNLQISQLI
jgi:hypothetical protein